MALRSIDDADYTADPVQVDKVDEKVQGQAQTVREPDSGEVKVNETFIKTDTVIVDPHHELAVQVLPEGDNTGFAPPAAQALRGKRAEDVFAEAEGADVDEGGKVDDGTVAAGPGTDANLGNQAPEDADGV